jgi:TolA-binding protein
MRCDRSFDKSSRQAESRFFYLTATRALGDIDTYVAQARDLVNDFPDSTWAAETLNISPRITSIVDDDAAATACSASSSRRFPDSRYAERAAWKVGWWAYKNGQFAAAAQAFESGAAAFRAAIPGGVVVLGPVRAHDPARRDAIANERYRVEVADYQNSYYGRLAAKILEGPQRVGCRR